MALQGIWIEGSSMTHPTLAPDDALQVAHMIECAVAAFDQPTSKISELLRTQHAAIERKDALLRRALDLTHEAQTYTESESWSPSMTRDLQTLRLAITKELQ